MNAGIKLKSSCISPVNAAPHGGQGAGIACWLECRTRDRKVTSSNPGRSGWRFSSPESTLCADSYSVSVPSPRVTEVARKRPLSFCQKCGWQVTPKHAYTLDPSTSEWADYAAVGVHQETISHTTSKGTLGYSRLSSMSHRGLTLT